MDSLSRLLILSIIIVWTSVLIEYQTLGSIFSRRSSSSSDTSSSNKGSSGSSSSGSFRFRETYHKVVDKKPDSSSSDSFRFRKTYHNIVDKKTDKPSQSYYDKNANKQTPPPIGWNIDSNNKPEYAFSNQEPKGGAHNLKDLAVYIKRNPNYGSSSHQRRPGYYYNYNLRPDRYNYIDGKLCTNNQNFDGIIYGQIRCPLLGYDFDETECCGPINYQYCCRPAFAKKTEIGMIAGIVFVSILCFCCCTCSCLFCILKSNQNKENVNNTNNEEKTKLDIENNENDKVNNVTNNDENEKSLQSPPPPPYFEKPTE